MSQFRFLILFFVLSSCQQAPPSNIQLYQKAKADNSVALTNAFQQSYQALFKRTTTDKQTLLFYAAHTRADATQLIDSIYTLNNYPVAIKDSLVTLLSNTSATHSKPAYRALHQKVRDNQQMHAVIEDLLVNQKIQIIHDALGTTDYHQGRMLELKVLQADLPEIARVLKSNAIEINQELNWKADLDKNYPFFQKGIASDINALRSFEDQLNQTSNIEEKIILQKAIFDQQEVLSIAALQLHESLSSKHYSHLLLSYYQDLNYTQPKQSTFKATLASNLNLGWNNFRQLLLRSALVWPYIILSVIFLTTILLAVSSSRKKARDFQLKILQNQAKLHQYSEHDNNKK